MGHISEMGVWIRGKMYGMTNDASNMLQSKAKTYYVTPWGVVGTKTIDDW